MKSTSLLARTALAGALVSLSLACAAQAQQAPAAVDGAPVLVPAVRAAHAARATMLASTRAGERIVAVGDHGVVLLSDDGGRSHRQARQVPVDVALTSVSFIDARQGWAAGHWGVILHTTDGGETWQVQRSDAAHDRPLFAVHFFDEKQGVAVGLWSLVLRTDDGGAHWQSVELAPPPGGKRADLNLFGLFADARGQLFAPGERGMVLRSGDKGRSWSYMPTGYAGSFWSGIAGPGGTLLVAGLRGSMYRSLDDGGSWQRVDTHTESSITALAGAGSKIVAVGLNGLVLNSEDGGASFAASTREDRLPLTSVVLDGQGHAAMYSRQGVVARAGDKDPSAR
ncbi:YCF48-related protein [Variovorax sp. CAN2819]|uniref:WD40/YVTN/BNR-like repeat-containing protein n=1 Tax=Variovorax sp. CAN15 TaxID=3046727 RepID=UPI002649A7BE|nr:YCF48-related protein [Variovorax sp. CAN15]MDN6882461.1 YCF48-related protein [Variovorax sp. CAN15]